MLLGQNLDVYERLGESLREELKVLQMQQRTWDDTHAAACRAEVAVLEQQLGKTRGALEPLQQARANLEKQTDEVLHAFFVGEMAEVRTQNKTLAQQLGLALDKSEQCSDWARRPLEPNQFTYAALDARILIDVYGALRERAAAELCAPLAAPEACPAGVCEPCAA